MPVTSTFQRDRVDTVPNTPTALSLRLYNHGAGKRDIVLVPSGDLAEHVTLAPTTVTLDTNEIVDVAVTVEIPVTLAPGSHPVGVHVTSQPVANRDRDPDDTPAEGIDMATDDLTVTATVDVGAVTAFTTSLTPPLSRGSAAGRHRVRVVNAGNVDVGVELIADSGDDAIDVELATTALTAAPGTTAETMLRVRPSSRYWSGPTRPHAFVIHTTASDGSTEELEATFVQRPRVPNWVGPALAGALVALLCGAIIWLAFLRPWVEDTADDAAADAIEQDREALQLRIDELEAAAADARQLPLGAPTDLVLTVGPAEGSVESASDDVAPGQRLSVTDLVFQNPTGAVGTVTLMRGDTVLLQSELANFRDFDLHLVAPFVFEQSEEITLEVDCRTAGAGLGVCPVTLTVLGFEDEVR